MRDAGHRTPDIGHRTTDIGHRTSDGEKSKNNISTPQGGGHIICHQAHRFGVGHVTTKNKHPTGPVPATYTDFLIILSPIPPVRCW